MLNSDTRTKSEAAMRRARRHWPTAMLAGVLLLALVLRLWGIGWGLPDAHRRSVSYHPDENTYLHRIATANPARGDLVIDMRGQAVVNYALAALLAGADVMGWFELQPSEDFYIVHQEQAARMYLLGRSISVATGLLSILLLYLIVRRTFPDAPWWLAPLGALFLAVAPGHVINSHYLETDVPVTCFVLLTAYLMIDLVQKGRVRDYALVGVSAGLAIGTKWSALPLLPLILVAHGLGQPAWWRPGAFLGPASVKRLLVLGLALVAVFVATNPYVALQPLDSASGVGQMGGWLFADWGPALLVDNLLTFLTDTLPSSLGWGITLLGGAGLILALVGRRRATVETLAVWWILLFGAIAVNTADATVGRTLPLAAFLVVLAVSAVARWLAWAARSSSRGLALSVGLSLSVLLALGASTAADLFFCCSDTARQDASRWIEAYVPAGSTFGLYRQEPYWDDPDILYQDFYHPAGGQSRYRYEIYALDTGVPPRPQADYLIRTQRDVRKIESALTPEQVTELRRWVADHYDEVAQFESAVVILGVEIRGWHRYLFTPHIQIFKRKG